MKQQFAHLIAYARFSTAFATFDGNLQTLYAIILAGGMNPNIFLVTACPLDGFPSELPLLTGGLIAAVFHEANLVQVT